MIRGGNGKLKGRRNRRGTTINREVVRRWRKPLTRFIYENEDRLPGLRVFMPRQFVIDDAVGRTFEIERKADHTTW
jgi:hypothetical protein